MIAILFAAAAALPFADLPDDRARGAACLAAIKADPTAATEQAEAWAARMPGAASRQCLGLAYVAAERWAPAAAAFAQAAQAAEQAGDGRAAGLWTQAGNAALAAGEPAAARDHLDHAIRLPGLPDPLKGEAWLDRARANVALEALAAARSDLDQGLRLVPADPFAWLLSATLARREKDLTRATADIAQAEKLAGDDPSVALEAGNIAAAAGRRDEANRAWTRAAQLGPGTPEAKAAAAALAGN